MGRVEASISEVEVDDDGRSKPGVRATCSRCDHTTESFGRGPGSRRRCLVLLREECPNNEDNFYADPDDDSGRPSDPVPKKWWDK